MHESFNQSGFSKFINSMAGRIFRIVVGIGFIVVGYLFREYTLGIISIVWGVVPLSAGVFDLCYVSALMGGPISGAKIREKQK
jgi:hypothetical protein